MLKDDIEMLMGHCRHSLSANGDLLGGMIRIKKFIEEAQKTSNNTGSLQCFNLDCPALWFPYQCTSSKFNQCIERVETQQAGA